MSGWVGGKEKLKVNLQIRASSELCPKTRLSYLGKTQLTSFARIEILKVTRMVEGTLMNSGSAFVASSTCVVTCSSDPPADYE